MLLQDIVKLVHQRGIPNHTARIGALHVPKQCPKSIREIQRRTEKGATLPRRSFAPACLQAAICTVILQLHVRQVAPWIAAPCRGCCEAAVDEP